MDKEQLKKEYEKILLRSEFQTKTNNWLKLHGKPMRRKPFKKRYIFFDEAHLMFSWVDAETYVDGLFKGNGRHRKLENVETTKELPMTIK